MTDRTLTRLAWATYGVVGAALLVSLGFFIFFLVVGAPWDAGRTILAVLFFIFPTVGVLITATQPRHAIGWTLLGIGLAWSISFLSDSYIWYAYVAEPGSLWRPDLLVALTSSEWIPAVGLMGIFLILLFPTGRPLSKRWGFFAWAAGINLAWQFVVTPFIPLSLRRITSNPDVPHDPNPLAIEALQPIIPVWRYAYVLIALSIFASAVSLVLRFRRSQGRERLQLKWVATAGAIAAFGFFILLLADAFARGRGEDLAFWQTVVSEIVPLSFALIPLSMGVAILKHRLYDIDVIINRSLVYVSLTTLLALVYAGGVVGVGGLVRGVGGDSDNSLVIAATTLMVAGLFGPARARIQTFIDRRFYRHKYDAARTVEGFSARLRDEIDLDELCADLVDTVSYTMQPTRVSVWLRPSSPSH